MSKDTDRPQIEIATDEDWKSRVKAEDAKLDAERQPQGAADDSRNEEPEELPPASFGSLIQMLASQAIAALGLIPGPDGQPHVQVKLARHFIDLLAVLEQKCQGNMSEQEARGVEQTLHELRMAYVEISRRESSKAKSPGAGD